MRSMCVQWTVTDLAIWSFRWSQKKIDKSYIDHSNFFPIGMTLIWTNMSIYVCNHWVGFGVGSEHLLPISFAQHLEYVSLNLSPRGLSNSKTLVYFRITYLHPYPSMISHDIVIVPSSNWCGYISETMSLLKIIKKCVCFCINRCLA
jgi:hypothetical protein